MMNPAILSDSCIWASKGAEVNRQATYTESAIPCQWEPRHGAYRSTNGDLTEYALELIVQQIGIKQGDIMRKGQESYTVVFVDDVYIRGHYHHSEVYAK